MNPPPLLVSFDSKEQILSVMPQGVRDRYSQQLIQLVERQLPPVVSIRVLALLFSYSTKFVGSMRADPEKYYRSFRIRKGKGYRPISSPKVSLKVIQRWMGFHIARAVEFPEYVTGFVQGRSHLDAARIHSAAKWIYSVDIENFFPSVSRFRVRHIFEELGYSSHASELCAALTCVHEGLAQGSPASPVIANLALSRLDIDLNQISSVDGIRYTRYADDLVFSGVGDPPSQEFMQKVKNMVQADGWKLAAGKEYFAALPKRLKVHGLIVDRDTPRLTRGYRNKIRAYRHMLKKENFPEKDARKIKGHLAYEDSVNRFFENLKP